MENLIKVCVNGEMREVEIGTKISEIISLDMLCGGHGKCGKCTVKAEGKLSLISEEEKKHLSSSQIKNGIRLACFTKVLGECVIEKIAKTENQSKILTDGVVAEFSLNLAFSKYGVAVDIGTTTIAAKLYDTNGKTLAKSSILNPQSVFGADVVSRIEASLNGNNAKIAEVIRSGLAELINSLSADANVSSSQIDSVVITGNTVMLHLLTETSVEPLSRAPFNAKRLFGETLKSKEIGINSLNDECEIYLPPCISAFVGADTVCAIISTEICKTDSTKMLVDIGTNGEIALWHDEKLTVCSTAAGPAFEGVGITNGMRGEKGAIDKVWLKDGKITAHVIGETEPEGICGSGIIDAVSVLLKTKDIDETGFMEEDFVTILDPVKITPKDIRAVQLAKSAICAGIKTAMKEFSLSVNDITELFLAGGFGNYLNLENAGKIDLIPKGLIENVTVSGNSALSGATMLLLDVNSRVKAVELAQKANVLDLASNKTFSEEYMEQMMF